MKRKDKKTGFIVAIDGPSGAGKSTVSRQLAESLQGRLLDTGAMYRAVGFYSLEAGLDEEQEVAKIAEQLKFAYDRKHEVLSVNKHDLGNKLRTEEVGARASYLSQFRLVREVLTRKQRALARQWSKRVAVVVEGRDIGTIVFPKVRFKFFVTASAEVRAKRRYQQLKRQGVKNITLKKILRQHHLRDHQDSTRKIAPLACPKDAVIVDTSEMAITQVVQFMKNHIQARRFPEK